MLLLLLACAATDAVDSGPATRADDAKAAGFVDTLAPDAVHLLINSTPGTGAAGHAIEETAVDFAARWVLDQSDGSGSSGTLRLPDGTTVYAHSWPPPDYGSALDAVDPEGNLLWQERDFFRNARAFVHGVVMTPDGDYILADTIESRIVAIDPTGTVLWEQSWREDVGVHWPNGITLRTDDEGTTRLAVTLLYSVGDYTNDRVELWRLTSRLTPPTREWSWPPVGTDTHATWTHGPHIIEDGTVTAALSATGSIIGLRDGERSWQIPPGPSPLAFPRDATFLPDGTLLIADAASEVLRVADPFGAFTVVDSHTANGVYSIDLLDCATSLCFGVP